jgi:large repetitive protein
VNVLVRHRLDALSQNLLDRRGIAAVQISVNGKPFVDAAFGNGTWHTALSVSDPEGKVLSVTVRAIDLAGRVTEITHNIAVDLSTANPPDTTITASPSNPAFMASASFSFTGTPGERGIGGYACQLDGSAFQTCASPQIFSALSKGMHTFQVRAIDSQGYVDPSPASYTWNITDAPAPGKVIYLSLIRR